jgi:hypothetical protein
VGWAVALPKGYDAAVTRGVPPANTPHGKQGR